MEPISLRPFVVQFPERCYVANSPDQRGFQRHIEYRCDDCGSDTGFRSRPRTFSERYLLPIFLLQPVRCSVCFRRDYRLLFVPVKERLPEPVRKMAAPVPQPDRNVA